MATSKKKANSAYSNKPCRKVSSTISICEEPPYAIAIIAQIAPAANITGLLFLRCVNSSAITKP